MASISDAQRIWQAGVEAVQPEQLLPAAIRVEGQTLSVESALGELVEADLRSVRRLLIVGGGKAGAGMARGIEAALGEEVLQNKRVEGLLSVPEDCLVETNSIRLIGGRPAGINEPREAGVAATREMLQLIGEATEEDLVICLLSGGGSALLPAPTAPLTLNDKVAITKLLAAGGATIDQLNTVRQQLSDVKGGGLARACNAHRLITLCISDVLGDPIDLIASGPTVPASSTPQDALNVLSDLGIDKAPEAQRVIDFLHSISSVDAVPPTTKCDFVLLANNATAVDAAGMEAERLGYNHAMQSASSSEGPAEEVGRRLAEMALSMRNSHDPLGPNCLISGGEPTVELAPESIRGRGGRNQQLVLAGLEQLGDCHGVTLLSGGTDGEDGPTDAAGAFIDEHIVRKARELNLDSTDAINRNDAYTFFKACDGLLQTGPTNTNVCDLRVVTVERTEA